MTRQETTVADAIGNPVGSQEMHRWTRQQLDTWIATGVIPRPKPKAIPRELRIAVWKRDDGICGICHEAADPLDWTCDHILPAALDGPTVVHNLRVTHPRCNRGRTHPLAMTDEQINDATDEWTANEFAVESPTFEEFLAAHPEGAPVTDGCRCEFCKRWRA